MSDENKIKPDYYVGSIAEFRDIDKLYQIFNASKRAGFRTASCIHPNQVAILNEELAPGSAAVDAARRLVEAYRENAEEGKGAFAFEGRMVDKPVYDRALRSLARAEKLGLHR